MSILQEQIDKARRRAIGIDLDALASEYSRPPSAMATDDQLADRRRFLAESLGDRIRAETTYERVIEGNELQPVNYLIRGAAAAKPVCRLRFRDGAGNTGFATGFLIAPGVLLTNNHVFPSRRSTEDAFAEFDLELDILDRPKTPSVFSLDASRLYLTSMQLDYSVVAVSRSGSEGRSIETFGFLPLIRATGKVADGEWLTIIQHPGGEKKQVCVRENKLLTRTPEVLWYSTDTTGGSSGSPVFNNSWQVVALHHKGVPETRNGVMQTLDGRDFDPAHDSENVIRWKANEGIRVSRLVRDLLDTAPDHPLLEPVFNMTPDRAEKVLADMVAEDAMFGGVPASSMAKPLDYRSAAIMTTRSITVTLDISEDGQVSVRQPDGTTQESFVERSRPPKEPLTRPAEIDVPFDLDYSPSGPRKGFNPKFLGGVHHVPLPNLGALAEDTTPLIGAAPGEPPVLNYFGYSVVMHKKRRLAIYTAANVDGSNRHALGRPHDEWRFDPRIPRSAQIASYYYENNQFDRGHLTRYKDMQFGPDPMSALQTAADTLHWTNCTPQHARFNENKQLWAGLELHILEGSVKSNAFRAMIFTGPVLDDGDPVWEKFKDIQYPIRFWKVAVALTSENKLFAAGFLLDQSEVIAKYGVEATVEVPFTAFKTYQVPVGEIERLTGLTFGAGTKASDRLSKYDPLSSPSAIRRQAASRSGASDFELTHRAVIPPGYVLLETREDIVRNQG
jgi:endonuclease G